MMCDYFARDVAYTYTRPSIRNTHNPRGGQFHAGLYPGICENVPLGGQTGATQMAVMRILR